MDLQQAVCVWEPFEAAIDLANSCRCAMETLPSGCAEQPSSAPQLPQLSEPCQERLWQPDQSFNAGQLCVEHFEGRALRTLPLRTDPQHQEVAKVRCVRRRNTDLRPGESAGIKLPSLKALCKIPAENTAVLNRGEHNRGCEPDGQTRTFAGAF